MTMGQTAKPKIFLSSTSLDLSAIRAEISHWLKGIFDIDLQIMETFGSDSVAPEVNSVRRVRESNYFIGIYAHRYGTIDENTGKSIVELELDEAKVAYSVGVVNDILLYVIDKDAPWPMQLQETNEVALKGLQRLKENGLPP